MGLKIFGDRISGNCLKVKWTADYLSIPYQWIDIDVLKDEAKTPAFLALNPAGQVPTVVLEDGRVLAQSNAIITYLAEGSDLIPTDGYDRAKMMEWMYWEQYSHEPYIAVVRFQRHMMGKSADQIEPRLIERGYGALARMEAGLTGRSYLASEHVSLADVALVAYTRLAPEGGFDIHEYPLVRAWMARVEADLNITD
jgi:glutathione S-transferase